MDVRRRERSMAESDCDLIECVGYIADRVKAGDCGLQMASNTDVAFVIAFSPHRDGQLVSYLNPMEG
jgi:hypothetical protein